MSFLKKLFKPKSDRDFSRQSGQIAAINEWTDKFAGLDEAGFAAQTQTFKSRLEEGESLDDVLPEAFGLVKAACKFLVGQTWDVAGSPTTWQMIPYDVQAAGGMVLHRGDIAEMATGEGKTLVATFPLYLNALEGKGCHLITVNDYLARRDSEWMGKLFSVLGLSVGCVQADMSNEDRKAAYGADITYGTNNEFGFDYLRDNMKSRIEDKVQRPHHFAIVDEVDSVLIDEARTPLIISGPVSHSTSSDQFRAFKPKVEQVVRRQTQLVNEQVKFAEANLDNADKEHEVALALLKVRRGAPKNNRFMKMVSEGGGVEKMIQRVEADLMREKRLHELDEELFFVVDEKGNSVSLTDLGRDALSAEDQELFVVPDISEEVARIDADESLQPVERVQAKDKLYRTFAERSDAMHNFNQLLKAYTLFEKDNEYVVQDGAVMIVDEFTGRLMPGRRFSDGLHQALEAKEGVKIEGETQTLATITLQNYFRMYKKLAGMTGTAETEAEEFGKIYSLDVQVIPTNEPIRRVDSEDVIYRTKREKFNAIVDEVAELNQQGLPVLVGTVSVEVSETLSRLLKRRGVKHNVLNAKQHQREAEIVAQAGQPGAVTIATNMAGRGTDIKLSPEVMRCDACRTAYAAPRDEHGKKPPREDCTADTMCGLHIIGTERHESRRIDRQLRGRAGRQGDPGESRFYLSLEDDLMRLFRSDRVAGVMDRIGVEEGEVITHPLITRSIERAQKKVEGYNFEVRKRLIDYDDVMNKQREVNYGRRDELMAADDLSEYIRTMLFDFVDSTIEEFINPSELPENWPLEECLAELENVLLYSFKAPEDISLQELTIATLKDHAQATADEALKMREEFLSRELEGEEYTREFQRFVMLQTIDEKWMDHLHELDALKEGIHFRAYAQKDPLIEYKREAFELFSKLNESIDREALYAMFHARIATRQRQAADLSRARTVHSDANAYDALGTAPQPQSPSVDPGAIGGGTTTATQAALNRRQAAPAEPVVRTEDKVGRNDPCPCGSGKKYKKCHGVGA